MNQPYIGRLGFAWALLLQLSGALAAPPCHAEVGLRVESRPIDAPIDAYFRVTQEGEPVTGLTPADLAVTLDGVHVEQFTLSLPPSQDSTQKVSVVIVIEADPFSRPPDFSGLVEQLGIGDFVSVVKYWGDIEFTRSGGLSVLPFTELDDGQGSEQVISFIQNAQPVGGFRSFFGGIMAALAQFETASSSLPAGPRAIVTVACCGGRPSLSDVIGRANAAGIAIFDTGRAEWARNKALVAHMKALAVNTGGVQIRLPEGANSKVALPPMARWLRDGYLVSIPHSAVSDCDRHRLTVRVGGELASAAFSRCDTTPDPFRFRERLDADYSRRVRSNTVTISGIESAVAVRVFGGEYSIGCGTAFTSEPGRIFPGETVCVRHVTAASGGREVGTLLIVGAVSSWFVSRTAF